MVENEQPKKEGLYKKLQEHIGLIASVIGIATGIAGIFGYQFGSSNTANKFHDYNEISTQRLNDLVGALPEEKRDVFSPLIQSIESITSASMAGDNQDTVIANIEAATDELNKFIKEAPILDYNISKSPFALPVGKSVLLCDDTFSVGFPGHRLNSGQIWLSIHKTRLKRYPLGNQINVVEGEKELTLIPLELLQEQKTVVLSYKCP